MIKVYSFSFLESTINDLEAILNTSWTETVISRKNEISGNVATLAARISQS